MSRALRPRVAAALDRLERAFGRPRPRNRRPPLDELVLTVLSQNTNDRNRDRAYASLRRAFPRWEDVLAAPGNDLEQAIRIGGLARTKSRVIRDLLARVRADRGGLDLDHLRTMPAARAKQYLRSFRGVGEKTACCVLLFSCGRPAFPVDTHILRVTRRLGWVPEKAGAGTAHDIMGRVVPAPRAYSGHVNLITLGRRHCRPRDPDCPRCPLRRLCRWARARSMPKS